MHSNEELIFSCPLTMKAVNLVVMFPFRKKYCLSLFTPENRTFKTSFQYPWPLTGQPFLHRRITGMHLIILQLF